MLDVAVGQTIYDAYDAVIFLAPIEKLHKTATFDYIYTPEFKREMERRYRILYAPEQIKSELAEQGVPNLQELFDKKFVGQPREIHPFSKMIAPLD